MCETERFSRLAELPSSCFKVVRKGVVMEGYQMAVIQEWALNRARWVSRMCVVISVRVYFFFVHLRNKTTML